MSLIHSQALRLISDRRRRSKVSPVLIELLPLLLCCGLNVLVSDNHHVIRIA